MDGCLKKIVDEKSSFGNGWRFFYAFFNGQAMIGGFAHILFYIVKEDDTMPKNAPVVRCVFESAERALPELLEESFRLYLHRILAGYGKVTIQ